MTRVTRAPWLPLALLVPSLVLGACDAPAIPATTVASAGGPPADSRRPDAVVDSVLPPDQALARFRADLEEPRTLSSGAPTRDELVRRVVDALAASDTAAFERLALNRAEWAWLYFPTSPTARPPYQLPPGLAWMQRQEGSRKGVLRALRELGGHRIDDRGYTCAPAPEVEGRNRLWTDCRVTLSRDGGEAVTLALFGAILERNGRFAILSFTNDF